MAGKDVELYYKKAYEMLQKGEFDKSLQLLEMVINIDDEYRPAWSCKGAVHLEREEYPQALAAFERIIELNIADDLAWYNKGYVLVLMGEYDQARKVFDFFMARYENKTDDFYKYALYLLAKSHYGLKNCDNAIIFLDEAIEMDENFKEAVDLKNTIENEKK